MKIIELKCDYQKNPVGLSTKTPMFSWRFETGAENTLQTDYQLQVAVDEAFESLTWDTGKVLSEESAQIIYGGEELLSSSKYYFRVRAKTNQEELSDWSETCCFVTTIFENSRLEGSFITAEKEGDEKLSFSSLYRKEFSVKDNIKAGYIYATAKGIYNLSVNGKEVGDGVLTPGWTEYGERILFQTYDVTSLLESGENAIGGAVGTGWYKGDLAAWLGNRNIYGKHSALYVQMCIIYDDGTQETVVTDSSWKTAKSPVTFSEIYHGETYDARLEQADWKKAGFDDTKWKPAGIESDDLKRLVPQDGLFVKRQETFKPVNIFKTPNGENVVDFGQNISGWVKISVKGSSGDKVALRHAEILDAEGNFYTENLRTAKQRIEYVLKGGADEVYEPQFTFQGFRYICVDEFPGEFSEENFLAVSIYSDMEKTGEFECSNPLVNQFISNVKWGMRDNFVDIPTDCPQRDERLGWTGDAEVFARAASYLMDTSVFFRKWLRDVAVSQYPDGGVPHVVPNVLKTAPGVDRLSESDNGACGWADAAVIIPWTVYKYFGDLQILKEQYQSMKNWVKYITDNSQDGTFWNSGFHYGDWVALDAEEGSYFGATPNELTATAFYAYSTSLMIKTAKALNKKEDEAYYTELLEKIRKAYQREFFDEEGFLNIKTQTAQILTLKFGLCPEEYKNNLVRTLLEIIKENDNSMTTGFLGTPFICYALSENGYLEEAYKLLLKEDYPSWLYQVTKGATTVWEHLDGLKDDGTMWSAEMNSFNHYAYGAVADWLFSVVGGIDTSEEKVGYKEIRISPKPSSELSWAKTSYKSLYGEVGVDWKIDDKRLFVTVKVPPNTTARLTLPKAKAEELDKGFTDVEEGAFKVLGSGEYSYSYNFID